MISMPFLPTSAVVIFLLTTLTTQHPSPIRAREIETSGLAPNVSTSSSSWLSKRMADSDVQISNVQIEQSRFAISSEYPPNTLQFALSQEGKPITGWKYMAKGDATQGFDIGSGGWKVTDWSSYPLTPEEGEKFSLILSLSSANMDSPRKMVLKFLPTNGMRATPETQFIPTHKQQNTAKFMPPDWNEPSSQEGFDAIDRVNVFDYQVDSRVE